MHPAGSTRRLATWIAALAVLLAALAPGLSQAFGRTTAANLVEVCSVQGSKWIADSGERGDAPQPGHMLAHCPYCSVHAQALGIPPAPMSVTLPVGLGDEVPSAFLATPRTRHAWVSALPRAPPKLS